MNSRGFIVRGLRRPRNPLDAETHGNAYRYGRGCRCDVCRAGWSVIQRERRARLRRGEGDFFVSADLCREHLLSLSAQHVGKDAVAAVTGIQDHYLWRIRSGRLKRVRMSTERRIMAVTEEARCDGSRVPARETTQRIDELRAMGYTLAQLGRMLGYVGSHSGVQFRGQQCVIAKNAMRVEKLYNRLMREKKMHVVRAIEGEDARVARMVELATRVA